jgi:hypothetical protein
MKTEYTLIVTKDDLILVNDEKEKVTLGKMYYELDNSIPIYSFTKETLPNEYYLQEVIAQSPNIKLSKELADELGWVDVEELAYACRREYQDSFEGMNNHIMMNGVHRQEGFKIGFQKRGELNNNKYSEEDMEKCHFHGWFQRERLEMLGKPTYSYPSNWKDMDYEERESWFFEKFIQSQQQPKQIKVNVTEENGVFNVSKINEYK